MLLTFNELNSTHKEKYNVKTMLESGITFNVLSYCKKCGDTLFCHIFADINKDRIMLCPSDNVHEDEDGSVTVLKKEAASDDN